MYPAHVPISPLDTPITPNTPFDIRALTHLDISSNNLVGEKGTGRYETVDAEYSDGSDEELPAEEEIMEPDFSGIIAIANAIPKMRALTKLVISKCRLQAEGGKALAAGLKGNRVITELNISDNDLGINSGNSADTSGIIAIANAIPDMGALTSLHVGQNGIPEKEMREIMPSLCAWKA
jgi:hypothetical protein